MKEILLSVLQGKIAGRGILLDFFSYAQKNGIKYAPNAYNTVTADDLEKCAEEQGVKFEQGDILFVRMGFIHWYENLATEDERMAFAQPPTKAVGIRQTLEEVEWMWCVPSIMRPAVDTDDMLWKGSSFCCCRFRHYWLRSCA